jgi:hypothetical protein
VKYYEEIINRETAFAEDKLSHYESVLEKEEAQLEDIERRLDDMENDMDKQLMQMEINIYNEFKQKNVIQEEDHQWHKLGKIVHWGSYLALKLDNKKESIEQGFDYNSPITPEVVCNDIISQLDLYQIYHPESKEYVASVKSFYTAVAKEELDYAGVLIYAFQDNIEHSIFKLGDIIIGYDGKKVKKMADLNAAFRINKYGSVKLLRLIDGNLKEIVLPQIKDTDVVGFGDLTE